MPSTPEGKNWYQRAYKRGQDRVRHPEWESWNFPAWENPYVYPKGFDDPEIQEQYKDNPNDPYFWQELGADFRALVGRVYPNFDEERHVRKWEFDPKLENYLTFDFGFSNPFACLDIQVTPSEDIKVWREYYEVKKPVHIHGAELLKRPQPKGYRIDGGYGDSADPGAVETLSSMIIPVVALDEAKDVKTGIQEVSKMIDQGRIQIDPSCTNLIDEFDEYRTKDADGRAARTELKDDPKDEPIKKSDHALDALRYFIMHHFYLGAHMSLADAQGDEDLGPDDDSYFHYDERSAFTMTGAFND